MGVETYRYLLSALMQVFGALVALDAIFLVLWYDSQSKRMSVVEEQLAFTIAMQERYPSGASAGTEEFRQVQEYAATLRVNKPHVLLSCAEARLERMREQTADAESGAGRTARNVAKSAGARDPVFVMKQGLSALSSWHGQYARLWHNINTFPRKVLGAMAPPVAMVVLFAIQLGSTDLVPCSLLRYVTGFSAIVAGACCLAWLVWMAFRTAKQSVGEDG